MSDHPDVAGAVQRRAEVFDAFETPAAVLALTPRTFANSVDAAATRLLIVEDDSGDVVLIEDCLTAEDSDWVVTLSAGSLTAALAILADNVMDCVVLDLGLPDTTDLDGLHRIMADHAGVAVVVLTGRDDTELALEAVRSGAQDYLSKSQLSPTSLRHAVSFAVERARTQLWERRLALLMNRSSEVVLVIGADRRVTYVSTSIEQVFGFAPDELLGTSSASITHPEDLPGFVAAIDSVLTGPDGLDSSLLMRVRHGDGSWRWTEATVANLLHDPAVGGLVINIRDVSARFRAIDDLAAEQGQREEAEDEIRFQARLLGAAGQPIIATDPTGVVRYWNSAARDTYGWTAEEAIGRDMRGLIPPADGWEAQVDEIRSRLQVGDHWSGEFWVQRKDGTRIPVMVTDTPLFDDEGALVATIEVSSDISDRLRNEATLARLSSIVESSNDAIWSQTLQGNITTWNSAAALLHGYSDVEIIGQHVLRLAPDAYAAEVESLLERVRHGQSVKNFETRRLRSDGTEFHVSITVSPLRDATGSVIGASTIARDVTERREAEIALEHLAFHDALTGLANRTTLTASLQDALVASAAIGRQVAVALLDIDHFKTINDSLGHDAGDTMLQAVARRLEGVLQPSEMLARFGGDEFAVIRGGIAGDGEDAEFGDRLQSAFQEPILIGQREFHVTISIGIVVSRFGDTADTIFRDADTAMYHAKATGRARVAMFDGALQLRNRRRLDLETELRSALEREQLRVVFQPILDLNTLRTTGFEALLRWTHPTFGVVTPDEFIPIAEESGLILSIGEWVLEQSLRQISRWRGADPLSQPSVAVNLSVRQLEQADLVDRVAAAVMSAGVSAGALHLEITESVLMGNIERSLETMVALRSLGTKISIDDFGTGYSSLSYLKRLPIDTLKIDRSFIDGLGTEPDDTSIVQAIVSLAKTLHMSVLAEGVESEVQLRSLTEIGCDQAQGFLWSPGVAPEAASRWLGRRATDIHPVVDATEMAGEAVSRLQVL